MKKLISISLLATLAACGGGCGGGGSEGGPSAGGISPSPAPNAKPILNYGPAFWSLGAGSYNALCGRTDKPRISILFKISSDGLLTPWRDKSLDLNSSTSFTFSRVLDASPASGIIAGFYAAGAVGMDVLGDNLGIAITSRGDISGIIPTLDTTAANELSRCDGATETAVLLTKSAYTAFAKYLDTPKITLVCSTPILNPGGNPNTSYEPYEISNGEFKFIGKTISLLTGIKKEFVSATGSGTGLDAAGATIYKKTLGYNLDKLDGTSVTLTINEFGEARSLVYKVGTNPALVCGQQT